MRKGFVIISFISAIIMLLNTTLTLAEVSPSQLAKHNTIAPMLKQAMPAVVNILVQGELPKIHDPFLKRQLEREHRGIEIDGNKFVALGSGVIINAKKGYIVTNAHVVDQAKTILVTLSDGRKFLAKTIGADDAYDIALLQIHAKHLTALPFGDASSLEVGEFVAAIGSPFGLNKTVTSGIVSALHRSDIGIEGFENFIQTDAPINAGNSGGALVNMAGQLIGINTAIVGPSGGNVGIGFAIPVNIVKSIIDQLLHYGKVERGVLGIQVQTLSPELALVLHLPYQKGAIVTQVVPYSPAAKAGLQRGDIIIKANRHVIDDKMQIRNMVGLMRTNTKLSLVIIRGHRQKHLIAIIKNAKESQKRLLLANPYLYGVTASNIVMDNPTYGIIHGVEVLQVSYNSPAWISKLHEGDIIISVNNHAITNVEDLKQVAQQDHSNGLLLNVLRHNGAFFIVIHRRVNSSN